ncbi:MAG: CvpA family protein [Betaproteobacteria bacterium]|nr:CvpA family protein [Betaproteobacteria bacterium]
MTLFDYAVLAILLMSVVVSVLRGLVREILSLIGWIAAFVVASLFASDVAQLLAPTLDPHGLGLIAAFLLVLVGMALVSAIIGWGVMKAVAAAGMTLADRGLGGLFGLARGLVIVVALAMVCGLTPIPKQPFWKQALLSPLVETMVETVKPFLPADIAGRVKF